MPADYTPGAEQLAKAAESGLATAQYLLGVLTDQGQGVPQDVARAVDLYRQAAAKGVRSAQARYGMALLQGRGTRRDVQDGASE